MDLGWGREPTSISRPPCGANTKVRRECWVTTVVPMTACYKGYPRKRGLWLRRDARADSQHGHACVRSIHHWHNPQIAHSTGSFISRNYGSPAIRVCIDMSVGRRFPLSLCYPRKFWWVRADGGRVLEELSVLRRGQSARDSWYHSGLSPSPNHGFRAWH